MVAAVIVLAVLAGADDRRRAFALPVDRVGPVAKLGAGDTACQEPLVAQEDYEIVELEAGSTGAPRLVVTVARPRGVGRPFARVEVPPPGRRGLVRADLGGTIPQETRFELCVTNLGDGVAAVYGSGAIANDLSAVTGDGAREGSDMALTFLRDEPVSVLAQLPEMFERAALFRPGFVGAWTYWLLLLAVVIGVPGLLFAALRETPES